MNRNNNGNQGRKDRNSAVDEDKDISTKRGFLIKLPAFQKNKKGSSSLLENQTVADSTGRIEKKPPQTDTVPHGRSGRVRPVAAENDTAAPARGERTSDAGGHPRADGGTAEKKAKRPAPPANPGAKAPFFPKQRGRNAAGAAKGTPAGTKLHVDAQKARETKVQKPAPGRTMSAGTDVGKRESAAKEQSAIVSLPNQNKNVAGQNNANRDRAGKQDGRDRQGQAGGGKNKRPPVPSPASESPKGQAQTMNHDRGKQDHGSQDRGKQDRGKKQGRSAPLSQQQGNTAPLTAPFSPLTALRTEKVKFFDEKSGTAEKILTDRKSLEECYKDAPPLAQQIAQKPKDALPQTEPASLAEKAEDNMEGGAERTEQGEQEQNVFEIIGVRFREAGKIYYFDPDHNDIAFGTPVIVETARGVEYGFCAIANRRVPADDIVPPLKKIVRIATEEDKKRNADNKAYEEKAAGVFEEKNERLGLGMTLIYVEYPFDQSKLLFYFTAEGRVDFRELVKELASVFRTRIELRQIGVRDEAKNIGGLGVCGRPLCCNTFLSDFAQVSIKMAKDQGLSLNSAKISGTCGRLMCCLRYEDEVYQSEYRRTPKVDAIVMTPEGKGVVVESNVIRGIVKVRLENRPDAPFMAFARDQVEVVGVADKKQDAVEEQLKDLVEE